MNKQKPKEPSNTSALDKINAEYTVSNAFKHGDKFTKLLEAGFTATEKGFTK